MIPVFRCAIVVVLSHLLVTSRANAVPCEKKYVRFEQPKLAVVKDLAESLTSSDLSIPASLAVSRADEGTIRGRYCPEKTSAFDGKGAKGQGCGDASVTLWPGGKAHYQPDKKAGTFCLEPTEDWGVRVMVHVRTTSQLPGYGECGEAFPGQVYQYSGANEARPIIDLRVWAGWGEKELGAERKAASEVGKTALLFQLKRAVLLKWAIALLDAPDASKVTAADGVDAVMKELNVKKWPDAKPWVDALESYKSELAAVEKGGLKDRCEFGARWTPIADDVPSIARLAHALESKDSDPQKALARLTLAFQKEGQQKFPFPVFAGTLPGTDQGFQLLATSADAGWRKHAGLIYGGDQFLFLAYNMARESKTAEGKFQGDRAVIVKGEQVKVEPSALVKVVLTLARTFLGAAEKSGAKTREDKAGTGCSEKEDEVCWNLANQLFKSLAPANLPPLPEGWIAPLTTHVVPSDVLDDNRRYDLRVCRNVEACGGDTDRDDISANLTVTTRARHLLISTATEIGGSFGNAYPAGGWAFKPRLGSSAPSKLYVLEPRDTWADRVTISQLLILYPLTLCPRWRGTWAEGWAVGFGPTLTVGGEAEVFNQWNARLMLEFPRSSGLLVSVGFSWRNFDVPFGIQQGNVIAGNDTPPSFATEGRWDRMVSIGLGIDLSILGDLWKQTESAFSANGEGGDKK